MTIRTLDKLQRVVITEMGDYQIKYPPTGMNTPQLHQAGVIEYEVIKARHYPNKNTGKIYLTPAGRLIKQLIMEAGTR